MKWKILGLAVLVAVIAAVALVLKGPSLQKKNPDAGMTMAEVKQRDDNAKENWAYSLGIQAYVYRRKLYCHF